MKQGLELVTDNKEQDIARIVVENDDGTKAIFFVSLTIDKQKRPRIEVIGKTKDAGEREAHVTADWQKLHPATL